MEYSAGEFIILISWLYSLALTQTTNFSKYATYLASKNIMIKATFLILYRTSLITLVGISWWWYFYVPIFDWGPPFCSPFVNPPTATWMDAPSFPTTHILRHFRKRRRCVRTLTYRSMVIFGSTNRDGTLANSHSPVRDFLIWKIPKQVNLTQPLHTKGCQRW